MFGTAGGSRHVVEAPGPTLDKFNERLGEIRRVGDVADLIGRHPHRLTASVFVDGTYTASLWLGTDIDVATQGEQQVDRAAAVAANANLLYGSSISDEPTCYKVFKTSLLRSLELACTGFEFCPEVTGKLLRRGVAICEVPISYHPRRIEEGKKIRWHDGVIALWTLLKLRF